MLNIETSTNVYSFDIDQEELYAALGNSLRLLDTHAAKTDPHVSLDNPTAGPYLKNLRAFFYQVSED